MFSALHYKELTGRTGFLKVSKKTSIQQLLIEILCDKIINDSNQQHFHICDKKPSGSQLKTGFYFYPDTNKRTRLRVVDGNATKTFDLNQLIEGKAPNPEKRKLLEKTSSNFPWVTGKTCQFSKKDESFVYFILSACRIKVKHFLTIMIDGVNYTQFADACIYPSYSKMRISSFYFCPRWNHFKRAIGLLLLA